jgi:hypothetical protein
MNANGRLKNIAYVGARKKEKREVTQTLRETPQFLCGLCEMDFMHSFQITILHITVSN